MLPHSTGRAARAQVLASKGKHSVTHNIMQRITLIILVASFVTSVALSAAGQVKVAPLDIKQRTMANGLHVITLRDNASPTVAIHFFIMSAEKMIRSANPGLHTCSNT